MSECNVCGEFTLSKTTCQLCVLGKKPNSLTINKFKRDYANRHRLPMPQVFTNEWATGLVSKRVSELFLTLGGLKGHFVQIQVEINRTKKSDIFVKNGRVTQKGKKLYTFIGKSIIKSANHANFNFPELQLEFPGDFKWLKIYKDNMVVKTNW